MTAQSLLRFMKIERFRYALICTKCKGHNGMALREEFEQVSIILFYSITFLTDISDSIPLLPLQHL